MKKLNLLYIFICASLISNAQIQQETFNGATLPMGWTATSSPSACNWQYGYTGTMPGSGFSNPASFPTGAAIFIDDGCADDGYSVELEGPAVDLVAAGVTSAAVEIIYNHQTFSNDGDFLVDVWDGSTWQNILTVSGDSPASNSGNNQTTNIDVTAHINNAFKVKFIYDDEDSLTWGIGIDDYKLLDTATAGIEDLVDLGFNYYPNPIVEDVLTLHANENISFVNIYNTIGQKVIAQRPVAIKSQIQMQHLPEGVYIVNVAIGQREGSFKVIKR
jgi:hypothetical protein